MSTTDPSSKTAEDYQREIDVRAAKTAGPAGPDPDEERSGILNRLIIEMSDMTIDELGVLDQFIGKYMREGRTEYGALQIAEDTRRLIDLILEAADEGLDREFYLGAAKLKRISDRKKLSELKDRINR
jgi:hypothetical protein